MSFGSDFQITIEYSRDATSTDAGDILATFATVVPSSVVSLGVDAPDYTISFTTPTAFTVQMNVSKVVQSVAGNATLTQGTIPGGVYVVDPAALAPYEITRAEAEVNGS